MKENVKEVTDILESNRFNHLKSVVRTAISKCTNDRISQEEDEEKMLSAFDSIEFIGLIVELERLLNIQFDDNKILSCYYDSIDDLVKYLIKKSCHKKETSE